MRALCPASKGCRSVSTLMDNTCSDIDEFAHSAAGCRSSCCRNIGRIQPSNRCRDHLQDSISSSEPVIERMLGLEGTCSGNDMFQLFTCHMGLHLRHLLWHGPSWPRIGTFDHLADASVVDLCLCVRLRPSNRPHQMGEHRVGTCCV